MCISPRSASLAEQRPEQVLTELAAMLPDLSLSGYSEPYSNVSEVRSVRRVSFSDSFIPSYNIRESVLACHLKELFGNSTTYRAREPQGLKRRPAHHVADVEQVKRLRDMTSASYDVSMTISDSECWDVDMAQLEASKTCADGCCDHSFGCKCGYCFCQVRADIQIDSNRTTYTEKGIGEPRYGSLNAVAALTASPMSLKTDYSSTLPIHVVRQQPWSCPGFAIPRPSSFLRATCTSDL